MTMLTSGLENISLAFDANVVTGPKGGTIASGVDTFDNHPVSATLFVLGSALLGLIGLRNRQNR
jgi:hypothetical protein